MGARATEETINDPTVRKHYWRYRCHVDLETLLEDKAFLLNIQRMLLGRHQTLWPLPLIGYRRDHTSNALILP